MNQGNIIIRFYTLKNSTKFKYNYKDNKFMIIKKWIKNIVLEKSKGG